MGIVIYVHNLRLISYCNKMNNSCFISRKLLVITAIVWLGLPLVIFLIGWLRPILGYPLAIGVIWASFRTISTLESSHEAIVYIDRKFWIMTAFVLMFTIFSGIGGFAYQRFWDHAFRNAVFNDLVNYPWPVVETNDEGVSELLCYYHAFWLPAAVIAKIAGSVLVGNIMQLIYAFVGYMTVAIFVFNIIGQRNIKLWVIVLLALFSGWNIVIFFISSPDLVKVFTVSEIYQVDKEISFGFLSAPGFPALSMFIYNSGIASWMAFGLLYDQRNNIPRLIFLYSLLFLFAPIPVVGLFPALTYWIYRKLKMAFSLENVIGVLIFLIVGVYFLSNHRTDGFKPTAFYSFGEFCWKTVVFVLLSYVIYLPYIWKYVRQDVFFWILCGTTIVIPYFSLNGQNDLGFRIGIPLTYCFVVLVIKSVSEIRQCPRYKAVGLIVTLIIGAINSSSIYSVSAVMSYRCIISGTQLRQTCMPTTFDDKVNPLKENFVARGESMFTKYLMKQ